VKCEPIAGEPLRFSVDSFSDRSVAQYLVDLEENDWEGRCDCVHFRTRVQKLFNEGQRGPVVRCKHIVAARECFFTMWAPIIANSGRLKSR
jgi:hypothetical protein